MKKYLDITSLINSDFYDKNQRLSWHVNHLEYDEFNNFLYNLFEKINLDGRNDVIFQLAKLEIYKDISAYLTHVYDYMILSSNNFKPTYSHKNSIYLDNIWKKKKIIFSSFIRDE